MTLEKKNIYKLLLRVENKAQKIKLFRSGEKCLLAVSGGQDSLCLTMFLRSFHRKFNLRFDMVYCNHAWQQDNFFTMMQITKYASYVKTGFFVFLNEKV